MYGCINEYEGQKINETDEFIVINKNRYRQGRKWEEYGKKGWI